MIDLPKALLRRGSSDVGPDGDAGEDEAFASWREPTERLVQAQAVTILDKLVVAAIAVVFAAGAVAGPSGRGTGSEGAVPPRAIAVQAAQEHDPCCASALARARAHEAPVARGQRPA